MSTSASASASASSSASASVSVSASVCVCEPKVFVVGAFECTCVFAHTRAVTHPLSLSHSLFLTLSTHHQEPPEEEEEEEERRRRRHLLSWVWVPGEGAAPKEAAHDMQESKYR